MAIPFDHPPIVVGDTAYDLTHLKAFATAIPGKGLDMGTGLGVTVAFSNHVVTERTKHGEWHHAVDHHGARRSFDRVRYEMSKTLPAVLKSRIEANVLTYVSRSFGGIDNLILLEMADGHTWTIVYCLHPMNDGQTVRMDILSSHPRLVDQRRISRKNLSYFARKCLFERRRIPPNEKGPG